MTQISNSSAPFDRRLSGAELVAITGVHYDDPENVRFELALQTAETYREANIPYVVVDSSPGGDDGWVSRAHRSRGAIVEVAERPGIASQRQQAARRALALGALRIISSEPEKTSMPLFAHLITRALHENDVLVIGRTEAAEASLPPVQRMTERLAGWILERTINLPPDALSGGRGLTSIGASYLLAYDSQEPSMNNWNYLYDVPLAARADSRPVDGLLVDLLHPREMVEEETDNPVFDRKRYDQFKLQLDHLLRRDDIVPEGRALASTILRHLAYINNDSTLREVAAYVRTIEDIAIQEGYTPATH